MYSVLLQPAMRRNPADRRGVTFIELLIVVSLLAILGMIVVPKFGFASDEARESALVSDVARIRRQINLYNAEHPGSAPHLDENGKLDASGFVNRLLERTDQDGKINAAGKLGPYIPVLPENPFSNHAEAQLVKFGTATRPPRDGSTGWYYCTRTGIFSPNSIKGAKSIDPPANIYIEQQMIAK